MVKGVPAVCVFGVPVLPLIAVSPGAGNSPGTRICSLAMEAAVMMMGDEILTLKFVPLAVPDAVRTQPVVVEVNNSTDVAKAPKLAGVPFTRGLVIFGSLP